MTVEYILENPRRLGWHRHHDPQNKEFRAMATVSPRPLIVRRWYGKTTAFDQGYIGSCGGNAAEGMAENTPLRVEGRGYTEDEAVWLYAYATRNDGIPGTYPSQDTGTTTPAVLKALKARGLISSYMWAFGFDEACQVLCNQGTLISGFNWYEQMDYPSRRAELTIGGDVRGGHLMMFDYINPQAPDWEGGGYVGGWNSWGRLWGPLAGRFRMSFVTWRRLLEEGGQVGIGYH